MFFGDLERVEVDARILVSSEAYVAELAGGARFDEGRVRAVVIEDPVRILEANNLVVLDQVDAVGLKSAERRIQLSHRLFFRPSVDLGHQENLVPVSVAQRFSHSDLARAAVVVPGVVHEVDATIDRAPNDSKAELLVYGRQAEVPAPESDRGHSFSGASKNAVL